MKGIRHFLRDFTATAVAEHLRSEIEATGGSPNLIANEVELVRFAALRTPAEADATASRHLVAVGAARRRNWSNDQGEKPGPLIDTVGMTSGGQVPCVTAETPGFCASSAEAVPPT
jgi:hypothetical protein